MTWKLRQRVEWAEASRRLLPFVDPHGMILPHHILKPYNGLNARDALANLLSVSTGAHCPH